MTNTQVFNLSTVGIYPYEKYSVAPITFALNNLPQDFTSIFWSELDGGGVALPTGGSLITKNYLNYHKNPLCNVLNYDDSNYNNYIKYDNINYTKFSNKFIVSLVGEVTGNRYIEEVSTATIYNTTTNKSSITYNASALRLDYKSPYNFYFFYIQLNDSTKNSYGFILYPNSIFLNPKEVTNNSGKWQLKTSVDVLSGTVIHIQSKDIETEALEIHRDRLNSIPSNVLTTLPVTLSSYNLWFSLYASRTFSDYPLISVDGFSSAPPTTAYRLTGLDEIAYINPDSTFVSYSAIYTSVENESLSITQNLKNDSYVFDVQKFNPTFLLNYNPTLENQQNFKLIQNRINSSYELFDTRNCVLSAAFNLTNGDFIFYNGNAASDIKMNQAYPLSFTGIINGYNLSTVSIGASSTLTGGELIINNGVGLVNKNILDAVSVSEVSAADITWETDYPPYCYAYNVALGDVTYADSYTLNFYLKLSSVYFDSKSALITAFAVSDFNAIKIPFLESESIKFKIASTSIENDYDFISGISCYYDNTPYDIVNSPYVPIKSGAVLELNYSNSKFNGIKFSIHGSVLTSSGQLDSFDTCNISLDSPVSDSGNKIFLNLLNEKSNEIWVDASFNVTESDWPSRDLRGTKILWYYDDYFDVDLNYIDSNGNFLAPVTGEDVFNSNTWKVKLSGYGPNVASVLLSSQKYDEVVRIYTNPNLFDFLSEGKLSVGAYVPLDNLNQTRSIRLTAAIPYGDRYFNIPSNVPINWTWEYDDISDPNIQPINVEQILNKNIDYTYGIDVKSTLISAIKLNVTPSYSDKYQKFHDVKVTATINAVQPPVTGSYSFRVDDFPSPNIFNCDFITLFTDFKDEEKNKIGDTRYIKNKTITRSWNSILNLTFSANQDVLPNTRDGYLLWGEQNILLPHTINENIYNIQLTDPISGLSASLVDNLLVSALNINLSLQNSYAPGWTSAHNVSATAHIYILDPGEFYSPMSFILYPEYAWVGKLSGTTYDFSNVTFLSTDPNDESYFTNAFAPTAYFHKKSNSQTFWLSANKTYFTEYIYQNTQNYETASSEKYYDVLDIAYDPFDISIVSGLPISLIAFNNSFYPNNMELGFIDYINKENLIIAGQYKELSAFNDNVLITQTHQITSKTLNQDYENNDVYKNFSKSPKLKLYNDVLFKFTPLCNGQRQKSFNIELSSGTISSEYRVSTYPIDKLPAKAVAGTINYYLSTQYWTVSTTVSLKTNLTSLSAFDDLFVIKYGDPSIPLYAGELGFTEFYLYAEPKLIQQIPWTTFSNYSSSYPRYPEDPSLWSEVLI
jgi:hypothetical protein